MKMRRAQYHAQIVREYESSKGIVEQYCNQHGINRKTFYYGHRKLRIKKQLSKDTFIPVQISPSPIIYTETSSAGQTWRALLPNGIILSIPMNADRHFLNTLINSLQGERP
ncbi:MAG: hypothetical protein JW795_19775 [Chitinivibrionales bacterium]|nr:hypothetical protein [Chitinivibrionales bacterium]